MQGIKKQPVNLMKINDCLADFIPGVRGIANS
jgi:hypothetical protein